MKTKYTPFFVEFCFQVFFFTFQSVNLQEYQLIRTMSLTNYTHCYSCLQAALAMMDHDIVSVIIIIESVDSISRDHSGPDVFTVKSRDYAPLFSACEMHTILKPSKNSSHN